MARKQKEIKCINKGYVYPDGTLHPEPPEEFIERVRWAFQVEYDNRLEKESRSDPNAG